MCKDILPAHMCMCDVHAVPTEGRRAHQLLWNRQSCEQPLQVLGTKPKPSARAASPSNRGASPPASLIWVLFCFYLLFPFLPTSSQSPVLSHVNVT